MCFMYLDGFVYNLSKSDKEKFKKVIIEKGTAKDIVKFACKVKGISKQDLEDAIIEKGDLDYIIDYASSVRGANKSRLEEVVIQSRNPQYIYRFARTVGIYNIEKMSNAILDTNDIYYILQYAKNILKIEKDELDYIMYMMAAKPTSQEELSISIDDKLYNERLEKIKKRIRTKDYK